MTKFDGARALLARPVVRETDLGFSGFKSFIEATGSTGTCIHMSKGKDGTMCTVLDDERRIDAADGNVEFLTNSEKKTMACNFTTRRLQRRRHTHLSRHTPIQ